MIFCLDPNLPRSPWGAGDDFVENDGFGELMLSTVDLATDDRNSKYGVGEKNLPCVHTLGQNQVEILRIFPCKIPLFAFDPNLSVPPWNITNTTLLHKQWPMWPVGLPFDGAGG